MEVLSEDETFLKFFISVVCILDNQCPKILCFVLTI